MTNPDEPQPPPRLPPSTAAAAGFFVLGLMGAVPSLTVLPDSISSSKNTTAAVAAVLLVFGPTFAVGLHAVDTAFLYLDHRNRHEKLAASAAPLTAQLSAAYGVPAAAVMVAVVVLAATASPEFLDVLAGLWTGDADERLAPAAVEDSGV